MTALTGCFIDSYEKVTDDIGLRHVEWYETPEVGDSAEESVETRALHRSPIHGLVTWLTSLVNPAPIPQVRRRHA